MLYMWRKIIKMEIIEKWKVIVISMVNIGDVLIAFVTYAVPK